MRTFRLARENIHSAHNFDACQIYVAEMIDLKGQLHPGIVSLWAGGMAVEVPHPLTAHKARQFAAELRSAASGSLPAKIRLRGQLINYFSGLWFSFQGPADAGAESHLVGSIKMGSLLGQARKSVRVSRAALIECAASIDALYAG